MLDLELEIGATGYQSSVKAGGKPLNGIQSLQLNVAVGEPTTLTLNGYQLRPFTVRGLFIPEDSPAYEAAQRLLAPR